MNTAIAHRAEIIGVPSRTVNRCESLSLVAWLAGYGAPLSRGQELLLESLGMAPAAIQFSTLAMIAWARAVLQTCQREPGG